MKRQLLKKYFIIFSIAIIIPVLFSYYINYAYSYDRLIENAIEEREDSLAQAVRSMDQVFLRAEAAAPQILLNDSVRNVMNIELTDSQAYVYDGDVELSQEYIMALALNSDIISEITLISFKNNILLSSAKFAVQELGDSSYRLSEEFELFNEPAYWDFDGQASKIFGIELENEFYYTQIVYEDIFNPIGMIIVSLNEAGILTTAEAILSEEEAIVFLSDRYGNLLVDTDRLPEEIDIQEYEDNYYESSYVSETEYLVIKNARTSYDYVLNMAIPMELIQVDRKMMNIFLIVYFANFIIIVLACYLTANNIANKFDKINKELDVNDKDFKFSSNEVERIKEHIAYMKQRILEEEMSKSYAEKENLKLTNQIIENKSNMKRNISFSLLYGGESRRNDAIGKLEDFDIKREGNYLVALVGFNEYLNEVTHIDESLSLNVKETIKSLFQAHVVNFAEIVDMFYSDSREGEKLVAVLNLNTQHDYISKLNNIMRRFHSSIKYDLKVELKVAVGSLMEDIIDLRHSYLEAYEMQKIQIFTSNSDIVISGLYKSESIEFSIDDFKNSFKELISHNDMEKIKALFLTFKKTMTDKDKFMYYCREVLEDLIKFSDNYKIDFIEEFYDMEDALKNFDKRFETKEEITDFLLDKVRIILTNRNKGTLSQSSLIMINVIAYINDNYQKDISLSQIADIFNISYSYLSKQFKKEMGESFKTYLTKIKIEMSAILLIQSSDSIENIAQKVGYNSLRQFYTMFKKFKKVTPAIYREKKGNC